MQTQETSFDRPQDLPPRYVVIEGPIGVGKTSLVQRLIKRWQCQSVLETFEDNPFLVNGFYENPKLRAFHTETYFLLSRYHQLRSFTKDQGLVVGDFFFEKNWIFAQMNMDGDELETYRLTYQALAPKLTKPDLVVYLHADLETLLRRIFYRGRNFEKSLKPEYLDRLMRDYTRYFMTYRDAPVLSIDTTRLDFVNDDRDFDKACQLIEDRLKGQVQLSLAARPAIY